MSLSSELYAKAQAVIPGGVNSPIRACKAVECEPLFIAKAHGSTITDVDGKDYVDYVMSWGPMLLGHADPVVHKAAREALENGSSFGAPCPTEVDLALKITQLMPSVEMVRMVNSGTEATMSALRLARGFTGRDHVVKFDGCYHGHADAFLAAAGSGVAVQAAPGTPGVPAATVAHTIVLPYNDLDAVKAAFKEKGKDIAAIIVEPAPGNMGLVIPKPGYLEGLRAVCDEYGALLIFDEVITGFRWGIGGAQARYGVRPDLTTLGKIIGAGFPVGAYGGRRDIMEKLSPCGPVFQAGTLSGNPVAMAAGLANLLELEKRDYAALEARTAELAKEFAAIVRSNGVPVQLNQTASAFTMYFTETPVTDMATARTSNGKVYTAIYQQMRAQGVYLASLGYECSFTSFAHTEADYEATLKAAKNLSL
ncbi:glutamate-1-semialdehyde 2,1-aminomutase [Fundidesulfovibrio agrisoli]|uniref:glutamate-1-semialdehyde 2,1-aminomutase n=1 Tax=Fundidesulfovibrio agrisoli TaxID=2922717 RepID=UPI001FADDDF4|nr:glutamate-1-semialdehyde 2,1-aminomutase [Fundidesulfovibrio agrisoli]